MMSNRVPRGDSGRISVAGFLYQWLALAALRAQGTVSGIDSDRDSLEAIIEAAGSTEILSEAFDQDGLFLQPAIEPAPSRGILVQCKYTRVGTTTIQPHDIIEILRVLDDAAAKAQEHGRTITAYLLITNRAITAKARKVQRVAPLPPEGTIFAVPTGLASLYLVDEQRMADWIDRLVTFGNALGCFPEEIDRAVDLLVGRLARGSERVDANLSREDLFDAFTSSRTARLLTSRAQAHFLQPSLPKISHDWLGDVDLCERSVLDEMLRYAQEHALIVLWGPGGCGKTATLLQWARRTADYDRAAESPTFTGSLTHLEPASNVGANWIAKVISDWAHLSQHSERRQENTTSAIERLCMANPSGARPILHLGIDGMDEGVTEGEGKRALKEVLRWCWEEDQTAASTGEHRVTLVVTCREDPGKFFDNWLNPRLDGTVAEHPGLAAVRMTEFSSHGAAALDELLLAAESAQESIRTRINAAVDPSSFELSDEINLFTSRQVDEEVLALLRYPWAWGSFMTLDVDRQQKVLDGDRVAVSKVAHGIVERICRKARMRNPQFDDVQQIRRLFGAVARGTTQDSLLNRRVWHAYCKASEAAASWLLHEKLLGEAQSSGLIIEVTADSYRWRHHSIWLFLKEEANLWGE